MVHAPPHTATLQDFQGIPHSTLANIPKTGVVPNKCRLRFPGVGAIDDRPRITIRKENMESSATTIIKPVKPTSNDGRRDSAELPLGRIIIPKLDQVISPQLVGKSNTTQ